MINLVNEDLPPTEKVRGMRDEGRPEGYIASALDEAGYSQKDIADAIRQAEIEPAAPEPEETSEEVVERAPEMPTYPSYPTPTPAYERSTKEEMEALIESIIEEKWSEMAGGVGDFNLWRERVKTEIIAIKQELLRLEHRFESVQSSLIGKVGEYDKNIKDIGTDIKALEKVLQRILQPLTTNIKELQKVTEKLKK